MDKLTKIKELISDFSDSVDTLEGALAWGYAETEGLAERSPEYNQAVLSRDGVLMRFEYTFELGWKLMKELNNIIGSPCNSPNDCIRMSAQNGIIQNPQDWLHYLESRNKITHVYKEENAKATYTLTPKFLEDAKLFLEVVRNKVSSLKDN